MGSDAKPIATPEVKAWAIGQPRQAQESKVGFYLVLAYLLFEFGRPQELIPGLGAIPFGLGLSVLIFLNVLMSGKLDFSRLQTKLWLPLFAVMAIHVPIAVNNFHALMTFKDMLLLYCVYRDLCGLARQDDDVNQDVVVYPCFFGGHGDSQGWGWDRCLDGGRERLLHGDEYGRPLWLFPIVF
jgi:hypothetical protein